MKRKFILGLLVAANFVLAGLLAGRLANRHVPEAVNQRPDREAPVSETPTDSQTATRSFSTTRHASVSSNIVPSTPFAKMYSADAKAFASNLRGIGCPEETVKDILFAEISRRYRAQEEALRPKPADHVPYTWSANPSERKLFQRRQQAAALAREKAAALREALGYEMPAAMPVYAMTVGEQRFEDSLAELATDKRNAARRAREDYWARVQVLQERTKGFWQSEDMAELEQLKTEHRSLLQNLLGNP